MKIEFPKTKVIGVKFLGFDGREKGYLQEPWQIAPADKELRDGKQYYAELMPPLTSESLVLGDLVVVSCRTGFQVCKVTELNSYEPQDYKLALVVACVDMSAYADYRQREEEKKRLRAALEIKKAELESRVVYEMLAEKDKDFAAMLAAFTELGGSLN